MLSDAELMRTARQVLLEGWDIDAQMRLKRARVLCFGAGGIGCPITQILARAGLGSAVVVDFDIVEASNLQRQGLFFEADIGRPKAICATEALCAHNPHGHYYPLDMALDEDNAHTLFERACLMMGGCDLVIDGTDTFATRDQINRLCVSRRMPLLSVSALGYGGQIALFEAGRGCYHCLFDPQDGAQDTNCTNSGVLASVTALMGAYGAECALHFLGLGQNIIRGQWVRYQKGRWHHGRFAPASSCYCQKDLDI